MNEYESWEVFNALVANLMQQQALFIGSLTAYVIAAHWVGKTLTTFQVLFISGVFVMLSILGVRSQLWFMENIENVGRGIESLILTDQSGGKFISVGFVGVRLVLILGALVYMWQVRHPKNE